MSSLQKTKIFSIAALGLLLFSFLLIAIPQTVLARGESYRQSDANTIIGQGGDYRNTVTYKKAGNVFKSGPVGSSQINNFGCSDDGFEIKDFGTRREVGSNYETPAKLDTTNACANSLSKDIVVTAPKTLGDQAASGTDSGTGSESRDEDTCESHGKMAWLFCPVIEILDTVFNWLDSTIQQLLSVDESKYNDPGLYTAWSRFRNIAYIILVPLMMVMVIGTAIGSGPFDAYTVKKALPRMVAATIFITLSWYICQFLINLFNVIGGGVLGLIASPFGLGGNMTLSQLFEDSLGGATVQYGGIFVAILALFKVPGLPGILLGFVFAAALILFITFLVLVLRQMFIILLLVLSPLAILTWIFPGNDKIWNFWRESFIKLLMMFPLIMALIASGRIFANVIGTADASGAEGGLLNPILKVAAYVLPYALIPLTFKFAGGVFATLTGMVNDRSRGVFDRIKKNRQAQTANIGRNIRSGSFLRERKSSGVSARINRRAAGLTTGVSGRFGFGHRGEGVLDPQIRAAAAEELKDPALQQFAYNDDGIMAMALAAGDTTGRRSRESLQRLGWSEERIDKAVGAAQGMRINKQRSMAALDLMARNKSFSLESGEAGMSEIIGAADSMAGVVRNADGTVIAGSKTLSDNIMGGFEYQSRAAGRMDLGGHNYDTGKVDLDNAWSKASLGQHAQGTGESLKSFADHHLKNLTAADPTKRRKSAIAMLEMQNMLPHATGANQEIINDTLSKMREIGTRDIGLDFNKTKQVLRRDKDNAPIIDSAGKPVYDNVPISTEDQIAQIATTGNAGSIARDQRGEILTSNSLQGLARVYDARVPVGERNPGDAPSAAPPPTAET